MRLIAQVPFVDVMNTMLDDTLPLTSEEWIEWGNPNEKKAWDYMVQYSPYENVKAQHYPNMLIEISLNDQQVPYWEGAKFAAKIREMKTDDNVHSVENKYGCRTRRFVRSIRSSKRDRVRLRLRTKSGRYRPINQRPRPRQW